MDELLGEFRAETEENLDRLDDELLRFEREPDNREILNKIFRLVHTIKGTCGFFGLERLSKLAHAAESRMARYREGETVSVAGVSLIFASLDRIKEILRGLESGVEPPGDDTALIASLLAQDDVAPKSTTVAPGPLESSPKDGAKADSSTQHTLSERPPVGELQSRARQFFNSSDAAAKPRAPVAPSAEAEPAPRSSETPAEKQDGTHGEAPETAPASGETAEPSSQDRKRDHAQSVRVQVETLEELMTTVSELVLTRNQLLDVARRTMETDLKQPLHRLSNVTSELQRGIMKARMLPVSKAWQGLPRLVRELSLTLDKSIKLVSEGGDAELDRQVLEFVRDPITHLIRNAADHGIESRERRRAKGKPEQAMIKLRAHTEGGHVVIEIADDGRGIDAESIRAKCLEKGLATEADLASMGVVDLQQFIFKPGFSTASKITDVSGRGVGLDVVRSDVELIGGTVELKSSGPQGTVFVMRIPLTLAITAALIVQSGDLKFALPQHSVREVVRAQEGSDYQIEMIDDAPQLRLRGRLVPVFDLAALLQQENGIGSSGEPVAETMTTVAVLELGSRVFGLRVDDVLRTEEIVVKPKASLLRSLTVFSGNTILGDGSVIMIIDPAALGSLAGLDELRLEIELAPEEPAGLAQEPEKTLPLLLFYAGSPARKAVPLSLVTRLEEIPVEQIETCDDGQLVRYRGGLMPVIFMDGVKRRTDGDLQPILVFGEEGQNVGLAIDEIIDVVEESLAMEIRSDTPGMIGTCLVHGQIVEVVDVSSYLTEGLGQRVMAKESGAKRSFKVLLVDDSQFFRNMLAPLLSANGYDVTLAASGHEALVLKEEGARFDLVISDLEMPDLDGIGLAEKVKADPDWADIPMIALSSHTSPRLVARSRAAGFSDYVGKFDRQRLIEAMQACCGEWEAAA